jgi:hypothetical protein
MPLRSQSILQDGEIVRPCSNCKIFADETRNFLVTQELGHLNFIENHNPTPNFGFSNKVYLVKFSLHNPGDSRDFIVQVDYAPLQKIDLYIPETGKLFRTGALLPFNSRPISHRTFVFPVHIPSRQTHNFVFRFESEGALEFPILAMSADTFRDQVHEEQLVLGLYYGIVLVLIVYNLILFFIVRDRGYLYYLLYVAGYGLTQMVLNGVAYEYFWSELPYWNSKSLVFGIGWTFFFGVLFARNFLHPEILAPRMDRFLSFLRFLLFFQMPLAFLLPYNWSIRIASILVILFTGAIFLTALTCVIRKYGPARYFLVAWFCLLVGGTLYALKGLGFLPVNFITDNFLQIGSALEMSLLSLGLADRIVVNEAEKQKARKKALESEREKQSVMLKTARLEIELLKKNIQPHFLLNSLNAATVWLEEDPRTAKRLIEALSEEMRLLLTVSAEILIPVSLEINLCRAHLEVMSLRLDQAYDLETSGFLGTETIPPLVFHTIIENGLTHGLKGRSHGHFLIEKSSSDGLTIFGIHNDGAANGGIGHGTGIRYVESRLEEAYSGRWSLHHGPKVDGYLTEIRITDQLPLDIPKPSQSVAFFIPENESEA